MPLTYEHIGGRADFRPLLDHLIQETKKWLPPAPGGHPAMESIVMQLDAIRRWTDNGRDPTIDERKSITIGMILVRQLESAPTAEFEVLKKQLSNLADYVKRWLTDDEMAAFDMDDIMSVFYEWDQ